MSTLAAARADNFYHGPDYDPAKHKSLNKYRNSNGALGARANKLDQGILIIRFEVPFHLWCTKCGEKVAKGERFNAEKKAIGAYHSTKIWEFRMNHHCGSRIIITTDPKNAQYCVVEGARQKVEEYTAEDAGVIELQAEDERERLRNDPLYRLEHGEKAKQQARTAVQQLQELQEVNEELHRDDYSANKKLRARLRAAKQEDAALDRKRDALGLPQSLQLLPEEESDSIAASIAFLTDDSKSRNLHAKSRTSILSQSIFSAASSQPRIKVKARGEPGAAATATAVLAAAAVTEGAGRPAGGRVVAGVALGPGGAGERKAASRVDPEAGPGGLPRSQESRMGEAAEGGVPAPARRPAAGAASSSGAGVPAAGPRSLPGAGALAAAASRGLHWAPRLGPGAEAGGSAGPRGTPGAGAGPAGAKRSLLGRAELLAKRHKLGGMQLQLGGRE